MPGDLNRATLVGRAGKDPTTKTMNSGDKVANFSLATSETWKNKDGEKQERVSWHNIVVWGKLAEIVEKYVRKGSKILVEGAIETRKYEKDGRDVYTTEIVLRGFDAKILLLGDAKGEGGERGSAQGRSEPEASQVDDPDDPVPF